VGFEAEAFHTVAEVTDDRLNWTVVEEAGAGGGRMVTVPANPTGSFDPGEGGRLDYELRIETPGTYRIWLRGYGPNRDQNAVFAGLSSSPVSVALREGTLSWVTRSSLEISTPGDYVFSIWLREKGAFVDRVLLTTDQLNVSEELFTDNQNLQPLLEITGADLQTAGTRARLRGEVSDGLGHDLAASVRTRWTLIEGDDGVLISAPGDLETDVSPLSVGDYRFRLLVDDGVVERFSEVTLRVGGYEDWALANGIQSVHGDPDQDGFSNLVEYAFSLDPHKDDRSGRWFTPSLVLGEEETPRLEFSIPNASREDLNYRIEFSQSLEPSSWSSVATMRGESGWEGEAVETILDPVQNNRILVRLNIPGERVRGFYRLAVWLR
ncbi:MAG: hypothetical protein AAF514_09575, partial [Verrucomicrobiota bacterium]